MARRDTEEDKQHTGEPNEIQDGGASGAGADNGKQGRYGLERTARIASDDFGAPIIGFVRETLSGTLHATGMVANDAVEVVRDVLTGAVTATESVGSHALGAVGTLAGGVVSTARGLLSDSVGGIRQVMRSTRGEQPQGTETEHLHARSPNDVTRTHQ